MALCTTKNNTCLSKYSFFNVFEGISPSWEPLFETICYASSSCNTDSWYIIRRSSQKKPPYLEIFPLQYFQVTLYHLKATLRGALACFLLYVHAVLIQNVMFQPKIILASPDVHFSIFFKKISSHENLYSQRFVMSDLHATGNPGI